MSAVQDVASDGPTDVSRDVSERPRSVLGGRKGGARSAAGGQQAPEAAWYSSAGLRRRFAKHQLAVNKPRDQDSPEAGDSPRQDEAGGRRLTLWKAATFTLALVAAAALAVAALSLSGVIRAPAGAPTPLSFHPQHGLSMLPAWREPAVAPHLELDPYFSAQPSPEECASADALPAVQALCARMAAPEVAAGPGDDAASRQPLPASALDSLALHCSAPGNAEACAAAAAVNSYAAGDQQATAQDAEAAAAHWSLEASLISGPGSIWSVTESLAVDCEADPVACHAAASVNSYEGAATAADAHQEAAPAAADAGARHQQQQGAGSSVRGLDLRCDGAGAGVTEACGSAAAANRYEGSEKWADTRAIAMEAAPQHLGVYYLDLDCSDQDPGMQAECQASRAANRYERPARPQQQPASGQADAAAAAAAALAAQAGRGKAHAAAYAARYPVETEALAAKGGKAAVGKATTAAGKQRRQRGGAAAQHYAAAVRSVGYDVPATEWDPIAAQLEWRQQAAAAAASGPGAAQGEQAGPAKSKQVPRRGGACGCGKDHKDPYHAHGDQAHGGDAAAADDAAAQAAYAATRGAPAYDAPATGAAAAAAYAASARTAGWDVAVGAAAGDGAADFAEAWTTEDWEGAAAPPSYARALRTAGYDAPALTADQAAAAGFDRAAAGSAPARRMHYKHPGNSPSARRRHYKRPHTAALHRVYYKNPANAPAQTPDSFGQAQDEAGAAAAGVLAAAWAVAGSGLGLALQAAAYFALAAASAAYLLLKRQQRRGPAGGQGGEEGAAQRRGVPHAVSAVFDPPAEQLLQSVAAAAGPAIAEPIPDHVDSPRASNFDSPRLAHKALVAGLELPGAADGPGGDAGAEEGGQSLLRPRAATPLGRPRTPVSASMLGREGQGAKGEDEW